MKHLATILFVLLSTAVFSQDWRYEEFIPKYTSDILDSTNLKEGRRHHILRNLSFVGAYADLYDIDTNEDEKIEKAFSMAIKNGQAQYAKDYIISKSADKQIVIVNESHHRPEHRLFTKSLLEELYKQGFRYLALEAIFTNQHAELTRYPDNKYNLGDTTILKRGYPLMKGCSGTYVKEPQFGNMIRKALDLGFTLIGYEYNRKNREYKQAEGIAKIFDTDPEAKVVVHCGYGHVCEMPQETTNPEKDTLMAGHLKYMTGINPLTISQTEYYNLGKISDMVFAESSSKLPQVVIIDDKPFTTHDDERSKKWDISVFHYNAVNSNRRPTWLSINAENNTFKIHDSDIFISYPIRIKLLATDDRLDAVPIDIIENTKPHGLNVLYGELREGKVIIENKNGDRQILMVKAEVN